jgi:hypothetical protein
VERTLPNRVERLLANISQHDWENVYVVLGDFPEVRQLVHLTLLVRTLLRRAPQAMIRGRMTSDEFVEAIRKIKDAIGVLRRDCETFAMRSGIKEGHDHGR